MTDIKQLIVWQKAHALALRCYHLASEMRCTQDVSLRSQIVRSAMSIPANIVEGRRQESQREFARFLRYALNSGCELEYHLIMARDIAAISESDASDLLNDVIDVRKMLHGLIVRVKSDMSGSPREKLQPEEAPSIKH